jgi:hypothetical protein
MITLTLVEQRVRQHLIECARNPKNPNDPKSACITYGGLASAVDPDHEMWKPPRYHGIGTALGHVSVYESQHHRPLLSALVVLAGINHPGDGFADDLGRKTLHLEIPEGGERAFWLDQVQQVVAFWSAPDLIMMLDGMHDDVMAELSKAKRLIRQLSQGQASI